MPKEGVAVATLDLDHFDVDAELVVANMNNVGVVRAVAEPAQSVYADQALFVLHRLVELVGKNVVFMKDTISYFIFAKLMAPLSWMMKGTMLKCLKRDFAAMKAHVESRPAMN